MFKVALVHIDDPDPTLPDWVLPELEARQIEIAVRQCDKTSEMVAVPADADVVWVYGGSKVISAESLVDLKRCRAIIRTGSGTDNIPVDEATEVGILVVNTPEANVEPVSDHVVGLLFSILHWIPQHDRELRRGGWVGDNTVLNIRLLGSTFGLVGLGRIARRVVEKLRPFDVNFVAYDPHLSASDMSKFGVVKADLQDVLKQSDVVSLHTPLIKETHHLIGERELGVMKPSSILINTSRGPVVDEPALIEALTTGRIAAAGLDVFESEPLAADSPLRQLENVVLTPHVASDDVERVYDFWRHSVDAVLEMSQGYLPASYVNPQAVDRCGFVPSRS